MPEITGTWRLVGAKSVDPQGQPLPPPYGPQAIGRIVFTSDKRILVSISDGRPELPAGTAREYGGYSFDGTTLITKVDAARPTRPSSGLPRSGASASGTTAWS
jgi:hypothetical protein